MISLDSKKYTHPFIWYLKFNLWIVNTFFKYVPDCSIQILNFDYDEFCRTSVWLKNRICFFNSDVNQILFITPIPLFENGKNWVSHIFFCSEKMSCIFQFLLYPRKLSKLSDLDVKIFQIWHLCFSAKIFSKCI